MVALAIMAIIAALSAQAFQTAATGAAATREAMERLARIDRTFVLIENDLRNALPKVVRGDMGQPLPPMFVAMNDDYWLTVLRGGFDNSLFQPRTEEVRIGYRYIDDTIWRDTWYNPANNDETEARKRRLLDGVRTMNLRVLPPTASSLAAGPWLDSWPPNPAAEDLPLALEITLELDDLGEVIRLFTLLPGKGGPMVPPGARGQGDRPQVGNSPYRGALDPNENAGDEQ